MFHILTFLALAHRKMGQIFEMEVAWHDSDDWSFQLFHSLKVTTILWAKTGFVGKVFDQYEGVMLKIEVDLPKQF